MVCNFQGENANNVFELVGIFVIISSYFTTTWAICQFFDDMPWCILLGVLYYAMNIYFALSMSDRPYKDEKKSYVFQSKHCQWLTSYSYLFIKKLCMHVQNSSRMGQKESVSWLHNKICVHINSHILGFLLERYS